MESRKSLGCELNPQWHLMNMRGTSRQHQENHEQETFENIKNLRFHSDGLCLFFLMHPHTNLCCTSHCDGNLCSQNDLDVSSRFFASGSERVF